MEVHHHPHVEKKRFKEYFLDFVMIFLAVTLGFFAETFREHTADKEREKVYIKNLYEDLKSDTVSYSNFFKANQDFFNSVDTLIKLIKSPDRNSRISKIYFLARMVTLPANNNLYLFFNQRTFSQMKSSGQLRLISNQEIADSISSYYSSLDVMQFQNENIASRTTDYMQMMGELFDAEILLKIREEGKEPPSENLKLLTTDPIMMNRYLTALQYYYGTRFSQKEIGAERSQKAKNLIGLLKKEYHLENQ